MAENEAVLSVYLKRRPEIKTGDLVEFASESVLAKAIRFFTKKDVNHSGLLIAPPDFCGLKDRRIILESLELGIEPNYLSERIVEVARKGGRIWWSPLKATYDGERERVGKWAIDTFVIKKPRYDYGSLFGQVFSRVSVEAHRFFCSEWVQRCYLESPVLARVIVAKWGDRAARPGDFAELGIHEERVQLL